MTNATTDDRRRFIAAAASLLQEKKWTAFETALISEGFTVSQFVMACEDHMVPVPASGLFAQYIANAINIPNHIILCDLAGQIGVDLVSQYKTKKLEDL
jgi:hypothetical protein